MIMVIVLLVKDIDHIKSERPDVCKKSTNFVSQRIVTIVIGVMIHKSLRS